MSKVIPKEQLTAYQRWELAAFENDGDDDRLSPADFSAASGTRAEATEVMLPTAEELERFHQDAWQEGYNLGLEEGRKDGFNTGRAEGEQYVQRLRELAEALDAESLRQDEQVAQEILALSLAVAQQVVRVALRLKPELVLVAIREALVSLPSLDGHHRILVHPDHGALVKEWLASEHSHLNWKVVEDRHMEPGDFRFESAQSEVEGSLRTRWQEIVECLGADARWLE